MKILLVDDENSTKVQEITDFLINDLHHVVIRATSGDQALQILCSELNVDLCLIDQQMPEKSGLELGRQISQSSEFCDIPLVMLTAHDDTSLAVPALAEHGFSYFVSKEVFAGNRIQETLDKVLNLPIVKDKKLNKQQSINYAETDILAVEFCLNGIELIASCFKKKYQKSTISELLFSHCFAAVEESMGGHLGDKKFSLQRLGHSRNEVYRKDSLGKIRDFFDNVNYTDEFIKKILTNKNSKAPSNKMNKYINANSEKVKFLLNKYSDKWPLSRMEFRPIQNI